MPFNVVTLQEYETESERYGSTLNPLCMVEEAIHKTPSTVPLCLHELSRLAKSIERGRKWIRG